MKFLVDDKEVYEMAEEFLKFSMPQQQKIKIIRR